MTLRLCTWAELAPSIPAAEESQRRIAELRALFPEDFARLDQMKREDLRLANWHAFWTVTEEHMQGAERGLHR